MTYYIHAGPPACSSQFALAHAAIVPQVRAWLARRYADIDEHLREDAITDTCLRLQRRPLPFVKGGKRLVDYLLSRAGGQLSNVRRKSYGSVRQRNLPLEKFDDFPEKFIRNDPTSNRDDYYFIEGLPEFVWERIRERLGSDDRRRLDLLRNGSVDAWTHELGIEHLPLSKRLARIREVKKALRRKVRRLAPKLFPEFF